MIITTTYTAESKKELQSLRRIFLDFEEIPGLEATMDDQEPYASVTVRESRRSRKGKATAEDGQAQLPMEAT